MTHLTTRRILGTTITALCALVLTGGLLASMTSETRDIDIEVSPRTLNLACQGQVVTVHTSIDYGLVAGASVSLNGVEIQSWKSDLRGDFVAKFSMDAIQDLPLVVGGYNTLTLTGDTKDGESFTGSSDVLVIDNGK